jgi:GTP-binding protein
LYRQNEFIAIINHRFSIVNISSAIFDCSAPDLDSCPDESLPEFAFIGRSNSGKSSLLNMLAGKGVLARVSTTPGFTKLINFFTMSKTWRLVDLPGYGFAEGAKKDSARFNAAVSDYLKRRTNLCLVFTLIDSGLEPQEMDVDFVEWLARNSVPFVLVFTKTDRGTPETVSANIAAFTARIAGWFEKLPEIFRCSSTTGNGRSELLGVIGTTLDAVPAESEPNPSPVALSTEVEPPFSPRVRAGNVREKEPRKKLKGARPW